MLSDANSGFQPNTSNHSVQFALTKTETIPELKASKALISNDRLIQANVLPDAFTNPNGRTASQADLSSAETWVDSYSSDESSGKTSEASAFKQPDSSDESSDNASDASTYKQTASVETLSVGTAQLPLETSGTATFVNAPTSLNNVESRNASVAVSSAPNLSAASQSFSAAAMAETHITIDFHRVARVQKSSAAPLLNAGAGSVLSVP